MNLPENFTGNIRHAFGERGAQWLQDLPGLLHQAARQWQLSLGEPFLLSYNYVCSASRANGQPVVLKIGVPNPELESEMAALQTWAGCGAVRLLEMDQENGMFLLEHLTPGKMLAEVEDDEQATEIAVTVMQKLWQPAPANDRFIRLSEWFSALQELRPHFGGGTGPFDGKWVQQVETRLPELLADPNPPILLHGDFHHYNVLQHDNDWLVIDPKGVVGPRGYEVGPLLTNPLGFANWRDARQTTQRRVAQLSEGLGMEKEIILNWAICHSLLSGWWDLAKDNSGTEYAAACAHIFMWLQDQ